MNVILNKCLRHKRECCCNSGRCSNKGSGEHNGQQSLSHAVVTLHRTARISGINSMDGLSSVDAVRD